jgi:hypothetical protein
MRTLFLIDSVAEITDAMRDHMVVTGSHGGASAARFAVAKSPFVVAFNDAGIGLEQAGIAGINLLAVHGIAAFAVAHSSARIGDARSTYESGVITHVNANAAALGVCTGQHCCDAVNALSNNFTAPSTTAVVNGAEEPSVPSSTDRA